MPDTRGAPDRTQPSGLRVTSPAVLHLRGVGGHPPAGENPVPPGRGKKLAEGSNIAAHPPTEEVLVMAERSIDEPTTHRYARAEVVGYPEPVLQAIRDLVHEVRLDPVLAFGSAQMMTATKELFADTRDGRPSELFSAIAHLLTVAAEVAVEKGSSR